MDANVQEQLAALQQQLAHVEAQVARLQEGERAASRRADLSEAAHDKAGQRTGADIEALQEGARRSVQRADRSEERADTAAQRVDALQARVDIDQELIRELQAEGLVSREHATNLEAALQTSRMIGAAVGIVMAFYGVTESAAFELLRQASMDGNRRLRAVAEEVVLTGKSQGLPPIEHL